MLLKEIFSVRMAFFLKISTLLKHSTVYKLLSCNLQELLICFNLKHYEYFEQKFLIHTFPPSIFKLEMFNSKNIDNMRNFTSFTSFNSKNSHTLGNLTSFKFFNSKSIHSPRFLTCFKLYNSKNIHSPRNLPSTPWIIILQEILHLSCCSTPRIFILQKTYIFQFVQLPRTFNFKL